MYNLEHLDLSWLSVEWFTPAFLKQLHWKHPFFLYLIPALPLLLLLRRAFHRRLRQKAELSKGQIPGGRNLSVHILRLVPYSVLLVSFSLILVALARPQTFSRVVEEEILGYDILLVIDISESMLLEDMKPNRLVVAQDVAAGFIESRKNDQIGLVVFSSETYTVSPLTKDYDVLREYLKNLDLSLVATGGTAIGDALATAYLRLQNSASNQKAIILITDGENTSGAIDPESAANLAAAAGIQIHAISLGTEGKILYRTPEGETQLVESYPDTRLMKKIASVTNGKFYTASSRRELLDSFSEIAGKTATRISVKQSDTAQDLYHIYLSWAMIFIILWMLIKSTFMANALED